MKCRIIVSVSLADGMTMLIRKSLLCRHSMNLAMHHEMVHKKIMEVVELYNDNKIDAAHARVREFDDARKKMFDAMDELYMS